MDEPGRFDIAKEIIETKDRIEKLEGEASKLKGVLEDLQKSFNLDLVMTGTESVTRHGVTFKPITQRFVTIKKEYESELFEQLRTQGHGDLITESVHYRAMTKLYEEIKDDEAAKPIAKLLNVHEKNLVSMRRTGGR